MLGLGDGSGTLRSPTHSRREQQSLIVPKTMFIISYIISAASVMNLIARMIAILDLFIALPK